MAHKKVTLSVDSKTYEAYKKYCQNSGVILSKRFELFMRKELERVKKHERQ